ncbi:type II secretion system protein GspF, partial [Klebsiella pneumoniae]|nr:type II secretion system protein GspF [Klebsiella pneumoniae]
MPAYSFEALDAQGHVRRGTLEADSPKAARSLLRAQALVPLDVEALAAGAAPGTPPTLAQRLFTRPVFNATGLSVWTRQLAGLVGS